MSQQFLILTEMKFYRDTFCSCCRALTVHGLIVVAVVHGHPPPPHSEPGSRSEACTVTQDFVVIEIPSGLTLGFQGHDTGSTSSYIRDKR